MHFSSETLAFGSLFGRNFGGYGLIRYVLFSFSPVSGTRSKDYFYFAYLQRKRLLLFKSVYNLGKNYLFIIRI